MRKLTQKQLCTMDAWIQQNARPYDRAKWNYLFGSGSKDAIVKEMLRYQNSDGGMGSGFEPDVICPLSAAIPTAEAIFQAYDYDLDCRSDWFASILRYFENTVQSIPKYWEDCPREAMDYPHAPWWSYAPCTTFSPNPCAAVASAMIRYGSESQRTLGMKIAEDCFALLVSEKFCGDHDSLNIIALIEQLSAIDSPLITDQIIAAMERRILENTCFDSSKWQEYTFAPLDFVSSPDSMWYDCVSRGIEENIEYWLDTIDEQGIWNPNFSWGIDSDVSRQVTENWKGYITVKRAKILLSFDRIEK
ncbi:MAG: hypothetical protein J6I45_09950 [Clostridia bacterium]|nr:hypothetical protein [Clostridia bacterium]